jgi:hypothetical protein
MRKTIAVTLSEGGPWISHETAKSARVQSVNAVLFEDGSVWDACVGFRSDAYNAFGRPGKACPGSAEMPLAEMP